MIQEINRYFGTDFASVREFSKAFTSGAIAGLGESFEDDMDTLLDLLAFVEAGEGERV